MRNLRTVSSPISYLVLPLGHSRSCSPCAVGPSVYFALGLENVSAFVIGVQHAANHQGWEEHLCWLPHLGQTVPSCEDEMALPIHISQTIRSSRILRVLWYSRNYCGSSKNWKTSSLRCLDWPSRHCSRYWCHYRPKSHWFFENQTLASPLVTYSLLISQMTCHPFSFAYDVLASAASRAPRWCR